MQESMSDSVFLLFFALVRSKHRATVGADLRGHQYRSKGFADTSSNAVL